MPVYVDDMYLYPMGRFGRMKMSHMVADTIEELHAMADKIGVDRKWVQRADLGKGWVHYDISIDKRAKAIAAGAVELTMRDLAKMTMAWKQARRLEREAATRTMSTGDRVRLANGIVRDLCRYLPPDGSEFPVTARLAWLQAVRDTLCLAHGLDPRQIEIAIVPKSATNG